MYQINLTDSTSRVFETEQNQYSLAGLVAGERYSVELKSVGINNAVNPVASETLRFQTGMSYFLFLNLCMQIRDND